jgi:glycosyltransferase involved in cell wall biosynthesis
MIFLYSDVVYKAGGIETYLHALATHLHQVGIAFRVAVSEQERSPLIDDLVQQGIDVYRQSMIRGDRWHLRKRILNVWLRFQLAPDDWVFCVRQPMPELYLGLVRAVHARGARIASSWIFAPEALGTPARLLERFSQAVRETDVVISVAQCTAHQFKKAYGYDGPVHVVNYHNLEVFQSPVPLPPAPPFRIGYMGRIEIVHKNLDMILEAFRELLRRRSDVELHIFGGGPDEEKFKAMVDGANLGNRVVLHGPYDHRRDLGRIISSCHLFIYPSRYEGGPCLSLLELLQAGRYVVTSPVGGIPDIYEGRPDLGIMVDPDSSLEFVAALEASLRKVASGAVDQLAMRAHYEKNFNMAAAHRAWTRALGIGKDGESCSSRI